MHQLITHQELNSEAQKRPYKIEVNLKPEDKNIRPTQWEDVYAILEKYDTIPEPLKNCSNLCIITRCRETYSDERSILHVTLYGQ